LKLQTTEHLIDNPNDVGNQTKQDRKSVSHISPCLKGAWLNDSGLLFWKGLLSPSWLLFLVPIMEVV
jgi:hypothetical protein